MTSYMTLFSSPKHDEVFFDKPNPKHDIFSMDMSLGPKQFPFVFIRVMPHPKISQLTRSVSQAEGHIGIRMPFCLLLLRKPLRSKFHWVWEMPLVPMNPFCNKCQNRSLGNYQLCPRNWIILHALSIQTVDRWVQPQNFWKNTEK